MQRGQLAGDATIYDFVTHLQNNPAQDGGVYPEIQVYIPAKPGVNPLPESLLLVGGEGHGAGDMRDLRPRPLGYEARQVGHHLSQHSNVTLAEQHIQKIPCVGPNIGWQYRIEPDLALGKIKLDMAQINQQGRIGSQPVTNGV
jgi:hypothetical protein